MWETLEITLKKKWESNDIITESVCANTELCKNKLDLENIPSFSFDDVIEIGHRSTK